MQKYFILILLPLIYAYVLSIWVPPNYDIGSIYNNVHLFDGLKPRAIFGTILEVLPWENYGKDYLANILRIISIFTWMYFINKQLYYSVLSREINKLNTNSLLTFLGLSFIFSVSSITLLNLSPIFIDALPFAIIAYVATSNYLLSEQEDTKKIFFITTLLILATLSHEKSIFDILILLVWFSWKWGVRKSLWHFSPALLISLILLILMSKKVTSGDSLIDYVFILGNGLTFFWEQSFNIFGVIFGGGVFWLLYLITANQFLKNLSPQRNKFLGLLTVFLMPLICISTLLVAHDTNRMVALIWLPLILIIKEINLYTVFYRFQSKLFLLVLCLIQALTPPMLIYKNGMVAFNCYGLWMSQLLPGELTRQKTNEQFGLFRWYRPDLTESFINKCNDDKGMVTHIIDRFTKDDLKKLIVIHDSKVSKNIASILRDLTLKLQVMDNSDLKIDVSQLPAEIKYVIILRSNGLPHNILNQYFNIFFKNKNIIAAEITSFRDQQDLIIDFTQYRWHYMTQQGLFNPPESWGAWSVSKEVVLKFSIPLPNQFDLVLNAKAFGPNIGKDFIVSLGQLKLPLKLGPNFSNHRLSMHNPQNINEIRILVPNPTTPYELNLSDDNRKLGIALKSLTIKW